MEFTQISLYLMAALYILAGINHFISPKMYLKITPEWVPYPDKVNLLVGTAEIVLGILLLFPESRATAACGIILLLLAIFPANVYHYQKARRKGKGVWLTLIRLPVQALLVYWAYLYT
ncbi:DoxX family protein [Catalinimonas niigatensis]|uniref:DoxX family protein n=1 Tax=Catalinimonas niigatensis TaxID=1397264 RepID=UPI0026657455|nr:MauE/DoxX family redox-associated membrane protein [Catalinimonas niigatensis]WPP50826.1 DoxX family protein [Catalinimonas niigatensis]